ncbi:MAG: hypothetical protein K8S25_17580 [Alphaproteobacteria bacterium]|nr:hypothetical protein [Alphaproteobacteria bacterium]
MLPQHEVNLFVSPAAEADWSGLTPVVPDSSESQLFSESGAEQPLVSLKLRGGSMDLEPSVNVKVSRLADTANFGGNVGTKSTGFDAQILNGRFSFSSDLMQTTDESDNRDFRDTQLREEPRTISLADTSRRHRFAAKVIDTENLRLLVDGEIGNVSENFANNFRELPTGQLVLPGSWSSLSSRLEFGEANVSVDYQDFVSHQESLRRQGVTLGFASSELKLYRKEGMEFNLTQGGQWLKRTAFTGINADVIVADVLPDAVADAIDPIRPFLPTSISGGFEKGDIVRSELLPGPRDRVSTANVAMTWDTRYGETSASFWERRINTDIVAAGRDDVPLAESRDRFIDVAHKIRRGNWQFGAGLSLIETDDTIAGNRRTESEIAPHLSVAYAPENGPTVELRLGAAEAQSQIIDDNVAARAKSRQLQLSVDLSSFAQEELNKPDAKLKLEYRYDLSGSDRDPVSGRERGGGHALLLTFSTPLN